MTRIMESDLACSTGSSNNVACSVSLGCNPIRSAKYYNLADQLIEKSSKDDIAETARLLAMNLTHYHSRYGALPLEETLAMIGMERPNGEQILLLSHAMEILVEVLGNVVMGVGQERH